MSATNQSGQGRWDSPNGTLWNVGVRDHSGLMLANLITLDHLSVSSAIRRPKSVGEPGNTVLPSVASCAFIFESASALLVSVFISSMISAGVLLGGWSDQGSVARRPRHVPLREAAGARTLHLAVTGGWRGDDHAGAAWLPS